MKRISEMRQVSTNRDLKKFKTFPPTLSSPGLLGSWTFLFLGPHLGNMEIPWARSQIRAAAACLCHSHINLGSDHICDLWHSLQQWHNIKPLNKNRESASSQTLCWIFTRWATKGTLGAELLNTCTWKLWDWPRLKKAWLYDTSHATPLPMSTVQCKTKPQLLPHLNKAEEWDGCRWS